MEKIQSITIINLDTKDRIKLTSLDKFIDIYAKEYCQAINTYLEYQNKSENCFLENLKDNFNTYTTFPIRILEIRNISLQKKKSAGNGEGSLYYSDTLKKWVYQYVINGKRHTLTQRKNETVKDFKSKVTDIKSRINTGSYIEKSTDSIISIIIDYIEQKHEDGITSDRSYNRDLETLDQIKKICSDFCYIPIQKVTIRNIESVKKEIKKFSNSVIDKIWRLLAKSFKIACSSSRRILVYNIMEDETLKKPLSIKENKKVKSLTNMEYKNLLNVLNNEVENPLYCNIVKMQLISGMRIGEVLARSMADYNKKDETLNVNNTLTLDRNSNIILGKHTKTYNKKTQTDEGQRYLPLDNELFIGLKQIIIEQYNKKITNVYGLLFWDYKKNDFIKPYEINAWLSRLNTKYHICDGSLSTHRLRHTALTLWKHKGIDLSVIQYLAGHVEGSNITEDIYIDITPEFVINELKKIV